MMEKLGDLGAAETRRLLQSDAGVRLRMGPYVARINTPLPDVAAAVDVLYRDYRLADVDTFVDFEVAVRRPPGLRRFWHRQVMFESEGQQPFNPLPGDQGFPLLEWGLNWCVYGQCHQHLTLHAAVLERNGRALILPAPSGSGKSTLCAGLLFSGWRLLSDELALIDPRQCNLLPLPRPVSLKNASIDVIRRFAPQVEFGSMIRETTKGVVAHFPAPAAAVAAAAERAEPGWIVLPKYVPDAPARLQPMERSHTLMRLIENAFNYDVFGLEGFRLLGTLVERSDCFSFEYSSLPEAARLFAQLADG
jgi:hypothetical protein